jgi:Na+/proline symporter
MTGLDQDMMQKNLSCKNVNDARKNMYWYGFTFIPVNFLFLTLGALLLMLAQQKGITLPVMSDEILPLFATSYLGKYVLVLFTLGIIAAAFSSADSALTALTTSFTVDILDVKHKSENEAKRTRLKVHFGIALLFILIIYVFKLVNNRSVIDAIYIIASYTYGPLLGMFTFGLFTKLNTSDKALPFIAVFSPIACALLDFASKKLFGYAFGYELLMLNGAITFTGMYLFRTKSKE